MEITFYYARTPGELFSIKEQCTIWLPETQPPDTGIWTSPQVIATCDLSYLFRLRDKIQEGSIAPADAIWIELKNQTAIGYIFEPTGRIANFFRIA